MSSERPDVRTEFLGSFGDFEVDIVLEILADHGIFAFAKHDPHEGDHAPYAGITTDRGVVMVESARAAEARGIVAEELPQHIASLEEPMRRMEQGELDQAGEHDDAGDRRSP